MTLGQKKGSNKKNSQVITADTIRFLNMRKDALHLFVLADWRLTIPLKQHVNYIHVSLSFDLCCSDVIVCIKLYISSLNATIGNEIKKIMFQVFSPIT